jgi:hypothetical protein
MLALSDRNGNNSSSNPQTLAETLANRGDGASDPKRLPKTGVSN